MNENKIKKCWPWLHHYKYSVTMSQHLNDINPRFIGGLKVYQCTKCSKRKLVYPSDVF